MYTNLEYSSLSLGLIYIQEYYVITIVMGHGVTSYFIRWDTSSYAIKCPGIKYPVQWVINGNDGWLMVNSLSSFIQEAEKSDLI